MKKWYYILAGLLVIILSGSQGLYSQNMLANPDFETWTIGPGGPPDNWALNPATSITATQEATIIHGGSFSCKLTWTTTSNRDLQQINIPVVAGNNYEFSAWVFDNDAGGQLAIYIRWEQAGGTYISNSTFIYSADDPSWQYLTTGSAEAPANAAQCQVRIRCYDVAGWPGTATCYLDDAKLQNLSGSLPMISKAYSISNTAVDVLYTTDITATDPGDFTLSGTANILFSSAVIDGTNPKLVHLSGASPAMVGDLTLDNLTDDGNSTSYEFYAGIMPIYNTNFNNPGGHVDGTHLATYKGIVSANDFYNNVWVSDAAGQYNGVLIYDFDFDALVTVGNEVVFTALWQNYNDQSELYDPELIETVSVGNPPYGPTLINGSYIGETIAANTNPAESYEGQLVKIQNFTVDSYVDYDYRCSWIDGGVTYYFHVGDNVDFHFTSAPLVVGASYLSITGVVDWYYSGPFYRINARNAADIVQVPITPVKLAVTSINNGNPPYAGQPFEVIVQSQDANGIAAPVAADLNFNFSTNGGTLGNVIFATGSTTSGTILSGTSQAIVSGVIMDPAGTGVTITATASGGVLSPGTSDPFDVLEVIIPDIIIVEIMQNPLATLDAKGEWFEVFNTTNTNIDMDGWIIKDNGTDLDTIDGTLIVPAQGFAVLGNNDTVAVNGGYTCNYVFDGFTLGNGDDEVILLLPDGATEVDRVEYDGGTVWPDPNGASMVFTGTTGDNNNDGSLWITATLREPTYQGTEGDKGSPGTEGQDQNLTTVVSEVTFDITVFLQGPYNPSTNLLKTTLNSGGHLPLIQPYGPTLPYYGNNNPFWLYSGTESVASFNANVVDWVLVEIRDAASAAQATSATVEVRFPALLMNDGKIMDLDGLNLPVIPPTIDLGCFVVIYHRNHLSVMNPEPIANVSNVYTWNFTTDAAQAYGGALGHKQLEPGAWGMFSADGNADNQVNTNDKINVWNVDASQSGYKGGDFNLDGQCNSQDKVDVYKPNAGQASQVPN